LDQQLLIQVQRLGQLEWEREQENSLKMEQQEREYSSSILNEIIPSEWCPPSGEERAATATVAGVGHKKGGFGEGEGVDNSRSSFWSSSKRSNSPNSVELKPALLQQQAMASYLPSLPPPVYLPPQPPPLSPYLTAIPGASSMESPPLNPKATVNPYLSAHSPEVQSGSSNPYLAVLPHQEQTPSNPYLQVPRANPYLNVPK